MNHLEDILKLLPDEKIKMIVADGVFSMEGDICDLHGITGLAEKYHALVMVDDAHALGVLGEKGKGTADHFGLTDKVDIIMGTFSKSLASIGGFIASGSKVVDYLKHHSRPLIFSASIPPAAAAAAMAALEIIQSEPERLEALWNNTSFMVKCLQEIGFEMNVSETPIIPIYIRDNALTFRFTQLLFEEGIFVNPVVSPAVKSDSSLIRMSIMATHTHHQLEEAIHKIEKVVNQVGLFDEKETHHGMYN